MKTIVITGSTKGIGYSLAKALLVKGNRVVISGRSKNTLNKAVKTLSNEFPKEMVLGIVCDVREFDQIQNLWKRSIEKFGVVDIWINNAGISNQQNSLWNIPVDEITAVVETNLLGEIFGTKIALIGFISQGYGAVYNLEGMGAQGRSRVNGLSIYGATKAGLRYFNDALPSEIDNPKIILGALQPGMVLTELVTGQYEGKPVEWEKVKGILTVISEDVDRVAVWMAEKILKNEKTGARFKYGGLMRMIIRMIRRNFKK